MSFFTKIFGDANEKYLKKIQLWVKKINDLEPEMKGLSDFQLQEKTKEFQQRLSNGETLNDLLPEAFALAREASKRTLNERHYGVQLIGAIAIHQGKIAQMANGEGKTLTATLPLYLNALEGKGAHLVTVNDYLARRDTVWMGQVYHLLGMSVGCINHEQAFLYDPEYKRPDKEKDKIRDEMGSFKVVEDFLRPVERKQAYLADITYGTNNEFGFDYLRDNLVYDVKDCVQKGFYYAIIDEVDSILIDEARTPLIISAPDFQAAKIYQGFARVIPRLKQGDYEIDEKLRVVTLTEKGIEKIERILGIENIYAEKGINLLPYLEQALKARFLFLKDRDYVVKQGEVIIVDEFTGRLMPGRRYSAGLHQAIEAKEGVAVQPESRTLATISFQNYFRLYEKLAGMTGTAVSSAEEFEKVYGLEVIKVPTHKPVQRKDLEDKVFSSRAGKFRTIIKEVKEAYSQERPVLVGTRSIEKNEELSQLLKKQGIPHQVLNAKNHEKEGEIIAQAGKLKAVTVATNMAGRGVNILLGGNPKDVEEEKKVLGLGGLKVIGTERHEARRIDDQLRGRAGRQGASGSSQFFLCLEDELLRIFGGARIKSLMERLEIPEDEPISAKLLSGAIEQAQQKIEGLHFDLRRQLLEYDDVVNKHRETIYKKRREVFQASNLKKIEKILYLRILDFFWQEHLEIMDDLRQSVRLRAYAGLDPLVEYKKEGLKLFRRLLEIIETSFARSLLELKTAT